MTGTVMLKSLTTPAVVIDREQLRANIAAMQKLASTHGVSLRPHIKTHKSPEIAAMQRDAGARGIACATIDEAEAFAEAGWDDIAIANEVVGDAKVARLAVLAEKVSISCAVDSPANVALLAQAASARGVTIRVLLDIDTGLHRCGLREYEDILKLGRVVTESPGVTLAGIMTHGGHAYGAKPEAIPAIGEDEGRQMVTLAERLREDGLTIDIVSAGSTPTSAHVVAVPGLTELRVGNYVFYDMIQAALGSCTVAQCSLTVLATVISTPSATRTVVDAGSKALTNDIGAHGGGGLPGFGFTSDKGVWLTRLSEEHGVIEHDGVSFAVGERVRIVPNHACPVMNLVGTAYLSDGETVTPFSTVARR